jgi:hypothetical protein
MIIQERLSFDFYEAPSDRRILVRQSPRAQSLRFMILLVLLSYAHQQNAFWLIATPLTRPTGQGNSPPAIDDKQWI